MVLCIFRHHQVSLQLVTTGLIGTLNQIDQFENKQIHWNVLTRRGNGPLGRSTQNWYLRCFTEWGWGGGGGGGAVGMYVTFFLTNNEQWRIQGGRHPARIENFLNFMQFLGKYVCWCLPLESWPPSYGESWIRLWWVGKRGSCSYPPLSTNNHYKRTISCCKHEQTSNKLSLNFSNSMNHGHFHQASFKEETIFQTLKNTTN